MKHTKGPWTCHSGMVWKDGPDVYPKGENNGIPIARMDREPGNGTVTTERDCNARLIAAAPELLDAATEMLSVLETIDFSTLDVNYDKCFWKDWEAAIPKAE